MDVHPTKNVSIGIDPYPGITGGSCQLRPRVSQELVFHHAPVPALFTRAEWSDTNRLHPICAGQDSVPSCTIRHPPIPCLLRWVSYGIFASPKHWAKLNIKARLGKPLQRPSLDACLEAETSICFQGLLWFEDMYGHVQSTTRLQRKEIIPQRVTRSPCTRFYGLASSNLSSSNFKGPTFRWGRNSSAWQFGSGICEQMRGIWIELNKSQMLHVTFTSTKRGPGWTWKLQLLQSAAIGLQAGLQHSGIRWAGSFTTQEQLLHTCRKTSSVCAFLNPTSTLFNARNV